MASATVRLFFASKRLFFSGLASEMLGHLVGAVVFEMRNSRAMRC